MGYLAVRILISAVIMVAAYLVDREVIVAVWRSRGISVAKRVDLVLTFLWVIVIAATLMGSFK